MTLSTGVRKYKRRKSVRVIDDPNYQKIRYQRAKAKFLSLTEEEKDKARAKSRAQSRIYYQKNRERCTAHTRKNRNKTKHVPEYWARRIASNIRDRCRVGGIPCSITYQSILPLIPQDMICPITKRKMVFGRSISGDNPSVDRIVPSLGYVDGNIAVISRQANLMKNNCIDPDAFYRLGDWLKNKLAEMDDENP